MLFAIIFSLFFVPYIILIAYYFYAWKNIPIARTNTEATVQLPFISVIIAARNEEHNIANCLTAILKQDYPTQLFEMIVSDDHSEDKTADIVQSFSQKNDFIRLIKLSEQSNGSAINSYKKKAIAVGIEYAKGALILTTDADCIAPVSWLRTIGSFYANEKAGMIVAPVKFLVPRSKNLFQKFFLIFQTLDFMTLQGITGAAIYKKFHYMANGANLAYPKLLFEKVNGFEEIDSIASGDDMLLMEKIGFSEKIKYLKSKEAIVSTHPEPTLKAFLNQRIRWGGKASAYADRKIKWIMALVYVVNAMLVFTAVGTLFSAFPYYDFLILFFVKLLIDFVFLVPISEFFGQKKLLWWFIIIAPFHVIYVFIAGWLGMFGNYSWKGRKVK